MKIEQFYLGNWGHYVNDDPYVKDMVRNRCITYNNPTEPAFFYLVSIQSLYLIITQALLL